MGCRKGHISVFSNRVLGSFLAMNRRELVSHLTKHLARIPSTRTSILWWTGAIRCLGSRLHLVTDVCGKIIWKWLVLSVWLINILTPVLQKDFCGHLVIQALKYLQYLLAWFWFKEFQLFAFKKVNRSEKHNQQNFERRTFLNNTLTKPINQQPLQMIVEKQSRSHVYFEPLLSFKIEEHFKN